MPERSQSRARSLIYNSLLLSLAAIIMRAVGVSFSVWISNRVGAEVMGLYSLCIGVWGFALTLATSGVNLATTRTVAEALRNGEESGGGTARAALRRALAYAVFFGCLAALLLIFSAEFIGVHILSDARTVRPLRLLGISLPAISVSSALGGYFSAVRRVWKSAAAQVAEQAVKIFAVAALLAHFMPRGAEWCCTALVLGGAVSEIASCLVAYIFYRRDLGRHIGKGRSELSGKESTRRLLATALPVSLSAYVRSGLNTVEHILIPEGLEKFGSTRGGALAEYGMLNAMVMPVVLFPYALIYSFTGLLIPEMTAAASLGQRHRISYISGRVWRLTVIFGVGVAGLFICFADELGLALYGSGQAARFIRLLGPLMPVMYLDTVTDSLLKARRAGVHHECKYCGRGDIRISGLCARARFRHFGLHSRAVYKRDHQFRPERGKAVEGQRHAPSRRALDIRARFLHNRGSLHRAPGTYGTAGSARGLSRRRDACLSYGTDRARVRRVSASYRMRGRRAFGLDKAVCAYQNQLM